MSTGAGAWGEGTESSKGCGRCSEKQDMVGYRDGGRRAEVARPEERWSLEKQGRREDRQGGGEERRGRDEETSR